jgi:hypothetical protein
MMYIQRKDIELIGDIMDVFPEARSFRLDCEECDGIGNILKLTVAATVFDREADLTFEISGVKDW